MYTILMNDDKSLTTSVYTTIYQGENLVDKVQFLLPTHYDGLELKPFQVNLKYIDQGNVPHCEVLLADIELYKEHIRCVLPLETELTRFAGTIQISLTLSYKDTETQKLYILHSGETEIEILPRKVGFQICESNNNDDEGSDNNPDDDNGDNSTSEENFPAVEF